MYQGNRNLYSFLAVLLTAGLIAGMGGIFLRLADQIGGSSQVASEEASSPGLSFPGASPSLAAPDSTSINSADTDLDSTDLDSTDLDSVDSDSASKSATEIPSSAAKTIGSHSAAVLSVAAARQTSIVASGSYDNSVRLWDPTGPTAVRSLAHDGAVNALVFSADGAQLITATDAGNIKLWDLDSGQLTATVAAGLGRVNTVAVEPRTGAIAGGGSNGSLKLWRLTADKSLETEPVVLSNAGPQINSLVFHPVDSNWLVSANQKGVVQVWDIEKGTPVVSLADGDEQVVSVDISRDGRYIAAGSYDKTIRVWSVETKALVQSIKAHESVVANVAFGLDPSLLASGSYDESIKLWDWASEQLLCSLNGSVGFVYDMAFADGGNTLVSGGYDGTVESWDLAANAACQML